MFFIFLKAYKTQQNANGRFYSLSYVEELKRRLEISEIILDYERAFRE